MAQSEAEVARKTDTIMAQADKDGDGVVTFDGEKNITTTPFQISSIKKHTPLCLLAAWYVRMSLI